MSSALSKTKIIILSTFILLAANTFNLDQSNILLFGKELRQLQSTHLLLQQELWRLSLHGSMTIYHNQGPYSQTILKNILCLFLHDLQIGMWHNFWLAKPYCLANQKLCYIHIYRKKYF